jgi:hypothetical protein
MWLALDEQRQVPLQDHVHLLLVVVAMNPPPLT